MSAIDAQVQRCADEIRRRWTATPAAGLILGTGLGDLANHVDIEESIAFDDLPGMPRATALGHKGRLICGTLGGAPLVAADGRLHVYEGYSTNETTLPVRLMRALGAKLLIVSNASGGLNPKFASGDVMVIDGHVNLMGRRVTAPTRIDAVTDRARSAVSPYDAELVERALAIARRNDFAAHRGVYVAVTGPCYETRAEYRFLRRIGDVVGMLTVPEVTVAAQSNMRVLALSIVTNVARPDAPQFVDPADVIAAGSRAEPRLRTIVSSVLTSRVMRR